MKKKTLVLLVGETGSGKDTVANMLPFPKVVSYKTGPMRSSDIQGVTHHFISDDKMDELEQSGNLIAWTKTGDIRYGATVNQLDDDVTIYIINPDGIRWFREHYKRDDLNVMVIGLFVPLEVRTDRCILRGDKEEALNKRINAEKWDYDYFRLNGEFDHLILNKDSEKTAATIHYLIRKDIVDIIDAAKDFDCDGE